MTALRVCRQTYTPEEVAGMFSVAKSTVYRWFDDGTIPVIRITTQTFRVPIEALHQKYPDLPRLFPIRH